MPADEERKREIVRGLWEAFEAREWEDALALLSPELIVEWPHSGERFIGRENFIAMNRRHPAPNWHIRVKRVLVEGDQAVSEVWVPTDAQPAFVTSFFDLRDGLITRIVEYWLDCDPEIPDWRGAYRERYEPDL